MVRHAVPVEPRTANDRLHDRWRALFWSSMILAIGIHFGAFAFWPDIRVQDVSYTPRELVAVEMPEKVDIPPPPEAIPRPATPVIGDATIDPDITIHATTFDTNPVESFALEAPRAVADEKQAITPETFTPYEVAPAVLNAAEVQAALADNYPDLLRQAGIGGTVRVWFWIDETGLVRDRQVLATSGHAQLDEAAIAVADIMRFSPAQNRDQFVPVGVTFPIRFVVR